MRIVSVARTATLTSLALFLSSGLGSVSGTPSYDSRAAISPEVETLFMEPWVQPCGTPVVAALQRQPQRHSVHRVLKRVRTQLKVAQNHLTKDIKHVRDIYAKVYKVLKKQYRMSWLPDKQFEWYYNEVWCLEKEKKAELALPRLYDALQRFAITFHHLRAFQLKSDINSDVTMSRRNKIIGDMQNEILRVLCEVETAIQDLGLKLPGAQTAMILKANSDWTNEGDLTVMLIQDWGVLQLYQTFLEEWTRAFRNATATGDHTCDPSMLSPLKLQPKRNGLGKTNGKLGGKLRKPRKGLRKRPARRPPGPGVARRPRKGGLLGRRLRKNRQRQHPRELLS